MTLPTVEATCSACGCLCEDLTIGDAEALVNSCAHGGRWFQAAMSDSHTNQPLVDGRSASLDHALESAANWLAQARMPLIAGLTELCVDGLRATVALADEIGAVIDASFTSEEPADYFPRLGSSGCTWGEAVHRADLIIYWRCNLAGDWWRHRELILDRIGPSRSYSVLETDLDVPDIWRLRAAQRGHNLGLTAAVSTIHEHVHQAAYTVIVHGNEPRITAALQGFAYEVNKVRRCRLIGLGGPLNSAGPAQVLRWQTGYSNTIGLHRGYPITFGREFSAENMLMAGGTDVVLTTGTTADRLSSNAREQLAKRLHINLALADRSTLTAPQITLPASIPGIDAAGTFFRSDGLMLPLRPVISSSRSSASLVINSITELIRRARLSV